MIHRGQDTTKNAAELMLNGTFGRVAVFHREQLRPSFLPVIILAPFKNYTGKKCNYFYARRLYHEFYRQANTNCRG